MSETILIIGSEGQVGTDLQYRLREIYGKNNVISSDIRPADPAKLDRGPYEQLDVLDHSRIAELFSKHKPTVIYHLAAMLSATAEQHPKKGWELNMDGTFSIFDACLEHGVKRIFWPSSIAVFGPTTPRVNTPQHCVMDPGTIYGISKLAGERYCEYYFKRYGLDVRSVRYPGLIGWKALPGGGTTDYAVDIFHQALKTKAYTSFLKADAMLPMMYMDDAIKATINITEAPAEQVKLRSSYNIAGCSFDPQTIASAIAKRIDGFTIDYAPDHRQKIAESWPQSIDDTVAREDWGWNPDFDLDKMVDEMLMRLSATASQ
ncbi:MAG: NAD-dependent epimerase/dehydratase family protein [Flavobacteriales bacterium]|nr:NAD-dependent epimerase/dehydratase family protein [Bacteroidota bacterium]MCB9240621.1 NAD-dependent epimerase/dehydratase family protein [Flavobacteriales bacterium]